ncbi:MAG: hypothetical protein ACLPPF_12300 [Rhodomicrobium sp.]
MLMGTDYHKDNIIKVKLKELHMTDVDLGYSHATEAVEKGNTFPLGVKPIRTVLPSGGVVSWCIGSLYNSDGSFGRREILMKFELTPGGKPEPNMLYGVHIATDKFGGVVASASANPGEGRGPWGAVDGVSTTWIQRGTRSHPVIPGAYPEVEPPAFTAAFMELVKTPQFHRAVDAHVAQAKAAASHDIGTPAVPLINPSIGHSMPAHP